MMIRMLLVACVAVLAASSAIAASITVDTYYPDYRYSVMKPAGIDRQLVTGCVLHFSLWPNSAGNLIGMQPARMREMTAQPGCAVLVIGGAGRSSGFRSAPIATVVHNIVLTVEEYGYDGVDIDWEPLTNWDDQSSIGLGPDAGRWQRFIKELRGALPHDIKLSIAIPYPHRNKKISLLEQMIGDVEPFVDRINLMAYSFAGPWPGWVTWSGSALSNRGRTFPGTATPLPSIEEMVDRYAAAGVPRGKMVLGIPAFCREWHGVTGPLQPAEGAWLRLGEYQLPEALRDYAGVPRLWDHLSQTPYYSVDQPGKRRYLTCDDKQSVGRKIAWAKLNGLAGVFVWEWTGGDQAFRNAFRAAQ